jgi:hypothetical protein
MKNNSFLFELGNFKCIAVSDGTFTYSDQSFLSPIHLEKPDWRPVFDFEPEQAATTKRKIFDKAAAEKSMVFAFHFPFPSLGYVNKKGNGWQWQPI